MRDHGRGETEQGRAQTEARRHPIQAHAHAHEAREGGVAADAGDQPACPRRAHQRRRALVAGGEVRLRYGYVVRCEEVLRDDAGGVMGLRVTADLDTLGLLGEIEDREIELPISDRSKTPIEPYLADQWFVAMDELSQSAMDAVTDEGVRVEVEDLDRDRPTDRRAAPSRRRARRCCAAASG